MAAGSCVVMRRFPNIERFFIDGYDCIVYDNEYELADIINFLKKNPETRNYIAQNGSLTANLKYRPINFVEQFKLSLI
jgi:spore maturation protein CgeB